MMNLSVTTLNKMSLYYECTLMVCSSLNISQIREPSLVTSAASILAVIFVLKLNLPNKNRSKIRASVLLQSFVLII